MIPVEISAVLAGEEDRVVDEAVAALAQRDQTRDPSPSPEDRRRNVRQLFRFVLRCLREGRVEPIMTRVTWAHKPG